jgi:RNA polymerase sigma-70 factor (ECF subfamily)
MVRRVLLQLPERQRECLALRAEGLSYAEIAGVLGLAPSSVGTLLARAERAFKDTYLAQRGGM